MAEKVSEEGESGGVDPDRCGSAKEYIIKRLRATDKPLTPSMLAAEYDCGKGHMQTTLSELAGEGRVERIARGKYTISEDSTAPETEEAGGESTAAQPEAAPSEESRSGEDSGEEGDGRLAPDAAEVARQWGHEGADQDAGEVPEGDLVDVDQEVREAVSGDVDDADQDDGDQEGEPVDVEVAEDDGGDWNIPIPVSTTTLLVVLLIGAVAMLYLNGRDGDGDLEVEDFTTTDDEQSRDQVTLLEG